MKNTADQTNAHAAVRPRTVVSVPREFVTRPFFPATRQTEARVLHIDDQVWSVGVERADGRGEYRPAMDIRHGRLCFALLSFRDRLNEFRQVHFSVNELAHRYAASNGGTYGRNLVELLFDLRDTWVRIEDPDRTEVEFSIVEQLRVHKKPVRRRDALAALKREKELWLDSVVLSPEFFGLLERIEKQAGLRLDVLTGMRSPTAQAIYAYIPSRAVHHDADDPFEITLTTLMEQIGLTVPKHRSVRKKTFCQNRHPVIDQLDGAEVVSGTLRADIVETADGADYKLRTWVERPAAVPVAGEPGGSKLLDVWTKHGGTKRRFDESLRTRRPLSYHHAALVERCGAEVAGHEPFYTMAVALIGAGPFERVLHEAKSERLEGGKFRNPGGLLAHRLKEAVAGAAARG